MVYRQFPSEKDNPYNIADGSTNSEFADFDFHTEGPESESRQFDGLYTEGDSDYGDAHEDTGGYPEHGADEASENEPKQVSDESHNFSYTGLWIRPSRHLFRYSSDRICTGISLSPLHPLSQYL